MNNIKRGSLMLFFIFLIPLLSGCWDQTSIEERAYVVAIGLDKSKSDNENQIQISYIIANPEFSKKEAMTTEPPMETITFDANDINVARNKANTVVAKEISFNLLSVIIVSEELAKDKNFIRWMYDATKEREIKRDTPLIVVKEESTKFFKQNQPKLESRIHKYYDLILKYASKAGMIPNSHSNLGRYYRITQADASLFLGIYGTSEKSEYKRSEEEDNFMAGQIEIGGESNKVQFMGSAVFKEGQMIGTLTGEETRAAVLINEGLNMGSIIATYKDPFDDRYRVTTRILQKEDIKIKMDLKSPLPTIDVSIPLYIDILSQHSMVDYVNDSEKRERLKQSIEEEVTNTYNKLIKKTQEEFKGEPFGWSLIARKEFLTIKEFEDFDWMETYPEIDVNLTVKVNIGNFGNQSKVPELEEMRD
ncbi:Ger(x)C family spore germination protein [Ureibacillus chungkukjangi]|uniref:Ger(X)C family germination protein n=1 Tax=Ureibacillus chungkukjangi TaxID=1202712 RepID=A0A318TN68_9BACL|nr:Ger(x)C family spore germination protein [Ureibacillus chungkukjangi]PYF06196.1 Ger(x)C family germination protein [Ureibacillus chungkukjangi]